MEVWKRIRGNSKGRQIEGTVGWEMGRLVKSRRREMN